MKLYQDIKDLDSLIDGLKKDLKYSKHQSIAVKRINTLIDVRNNYNNILNQNFYFESLDALILSNVLLRLKLEKIEVPRHADIQLIFKEIFKDIKNGSYLKYKELEWQICLGIDLKNLENGDDEKLLEVKQKDKIEKAIMDMLYVLKTDMVWHLKK